MFDKNMEPQLELIQQVQSGKIASIIFVYFTHEITLLFAKLITLLPSCHKMLLQQ